MLIFWLRSHLLSLIYDISYLSLNPKKCICFSLSHLHHSPPPRPGHYHVFFCPKIVRSNILHVQPIYHHTEFFLSHSWGHTIKTIKKIQTKRWLQEHPQTQGKTKCFPVLKPLRIYKRVGRNLFHHLKIIIFKLNLIYITLLPVLLLSASQLAFISIL